VEHAVRAIVVATLAIVVGATCSIERRTDGLRCDGPEDCDGDRVCAGGYCVDEDEVIDGAPADADPRCPAVCDSCSDLSPDGTRYANCEIDCGGTGECSDGVVCPPGMDCVIDCNGTGACAGGVDCSMAEECEVDCFGTNACGDGVVCGTRECDVHCIGNGACDDGVVCGAACSCVVACDAGACDTDPACTNPMCRLDDGCSATANAICDQCD
jgi:hypothetical protein